MIPGNRSEGGRLRRELQREQDSIEILRAEFLPATVDQRPGCAEETAPRYWGITDCRLRNLHYITTRFRARRRARTGRVAVVTAKWH